MYIILAFLLLKYNYMKMNFTNLNFIHVGWYIYIETSSPRVQGDKARLISPLVTSSSNARCLEFWYHMYGADVNTLNVYTNTTSLESLVFSVSGLQGNEWNKAQVNLQVAQAFQVSQP